MWISPPRILKFQEGKNHGKEKREHIVTASSSFRKENGTKPCERSGGKQDTPNDSPNGTMRSSLSDRTQRSSTTFPKLKTPSVFLMSAGRANLYMPMYVLSATFSKIYESRTMREGTKVCDGRLDVCRASVRTRKTAEL